MDYKFEDFVKYKQYLNGVDALIKKFFENQQEFICCKSGCSYCCERGQYPYSDLEFKYLLLGFFKVDADERMKIVKRINALKEEYSKCEDKSNFSHRCPFLSDEKVCTVYDYRGLICRIFGLIIEHSDGSLTLPFCIDMGLNYSKVYNLETKKIDYDKVKELNYKQKPIATKANLKYLKSGELFVGELLDFGDLKPLIEWL